MKISFLLTEEMPRGVPRAGFRKPRRTTLFPEDLRPEKFLEVRENERERRKLAACINRMLRQNSGECTVGIHFHGEPLSSVIVDPIIEELTGRGFHVERNTQLIAVQINDTIVTIDAPVLEISSEKRS